MNLEEEILEKSQDIAVHPQNLWVNSGSGKLPSV